MRTPSALLSFRNSLPVKLAVIAAIIFFAVTALRMLSLDQLAQVDAVSEQVRNRWLESVRDLGNLTHHIADVRIMEGEALVGSGQPGIDGFGKDLQQALDRVDQDLDRYRSLQHDDDEIQSLRTFLEAWSEHSRYAQQIASLAASGQKTELTGLFAGAAHSSYARASNALRDLTGITELKAVSASKIAADTIAQAQSFISDLILATLALFASLAVYIWLSFSRPLLDLAARMRRLATHDTTFAIPYENRRDEIGEMARSLVVFQRNIVELLESRKKLARQAGILTGLLEKERALAIEQRNFITTMSHEFRTPLTLIDGNAQRLFATRERVTPAQIADRAHRIRAAVFQMTNLVVSLTSAMEMTDSSVALRTRPFDLSKLLRDLVSYYRAVGDHGAIEEEFGEVPQEMTGDPELLHYAFSNLISNAFKYSPENGIVTLTARLDGGFVEVAVEDRGIGIPPGEIERVRERFYRGSNVDSIPGTGVGLHLVDRIVQQHGGRLNIASELGKGTCVTVSLSLDGDRPA